MELRDGEQYRGAMLPFQQPLPVPAIGSMSAHVKELGRQEEKVKHQSTIQ